MKVARSFAILPAVMGMVYFSHSSDFWQQLRTFGWQPVKIITKRHTLVPARMGFWDAGTHGTVSFTIEGDHENREWMDHVFERFSFDKSTAKTTRYIESLAPGSAHMGFKSPDGKRISFGYFPRSFGYDFAFAGFGSLLMAFMIWRQGSRATVKSDSEPVTT